jgi:hypothetical protein
MDKIKKSKMEKKQIEMQLSGPEAKMRRKLMESAMLQDQGVPPVAPSRLQPMAPEPPVAAPMKKGGKITAANYDKEYGKIYRKAVKKMSSGGTASSRADGIATKGKTRGKIC